MDKRFLAILGALVIIFIGAFAITSHSSKNGSAAPVNSSLATNHRQGEGKSGVVLVEYGDYECPVCAEYSQPLKQVVSQFSSQIYFQFKNLPLTQIHQNAFAAARAAEAASLQGKFWEMHDALYQNQTSWASSSNPLKIFDQYAKAIGLNISQFDTDYASSKVNDSINADLAAFDKTKQEKATPTFFLDGKYIPNSKLVDSSGQVSVSNFANLINAEITAEEKH